MKAQRFNELARAAGLGRHFKDGTGKRSLKAARLHLVHGLPVEEARIKAGNISKQSVYEVLRKLPTRTCPTCHQPMPEDRPKASRS
jgi:hypothetical protein